MKFDEIVDLSLSFWLNDMAKATTICLLGPPGIGKSAVGKTLAARMTVAARGKGASESAVCEVVDLSSRAPEDISGLPFKGNELGFGSVTDYAPQRWLARLCQDGVYGVLILDDLPAASPAVQVATRQLALDRRVGDKHLSPNVILIVTGNRREDKSAATTLPAHFRNSVMMLDLQVDLDEWCAWYGGQEGHAPVIASFLRRRPALLSGLPSNSDSRGAFPTPRAWTKLGSVYDIAERRRVVLPVAEGLVGEGAAAEFVAFTNIRRELASVSSVLLDPKATLPFPDRELSMPDRIYALVSGMGETAVQWAKGHKDPKVQRQAPLMFIKALSWVAQGNMEYVSVGLAVYRDNAGKELMNDFLRVARENRNDLDVQRLTTYLASVWVKETSDAA